MSSSASEFVASQNESIAQKTWNSLPYNVNTQVSYWNQHQQQKLHNVYSHQNYPSSQHRISQNQIQPTIPIAQQWSQKQTNINYAAPTNHHLYQKTQLLQQNQLQMTMNHQFRPQLTLSKTQYQPSELHVQISLVPNQKGGYKAVLKRNKRKRTMFTTEQLEFLESYFSSKPYVTRDERQVLVKTLNVSDSAIKVWFQNRRIRSKRDQEQKFDEEDSGISTGSSPLLPNSSTSSISDADTSTDLDKILRELTKNQAWKNKDKSNIDEILNCPITPQSDSHTFSSKLDEIESKIKQKTDEFGNVHLSDELLTEIMTIVDKILPQDLDLDELQKSSYEKISVTVEQQNENKETEEKYPNDEQNINMEILTDSKNNFEQMLTEKKLNHSKTEIVGIIHDGEVHMTAIENVGYCYIIDSGEYSEKNTCTVAMYEPISPAESLDDQEIILNNTPLNKNTIPKDKLQEIFDKVFC